MRLRRSTALLSVLTAISLGAGGLSVSMATATAAPASGVAAVCTPSQAVGVAHCEAFRLLNPATWVGQHVPNAKSGPNKSGHGHPTSTTTSTTTSTSTTTTTIATTGISGFYPSDLQSAYNLPSLVTEFTPSSRPTVAIVDAYNDPSAYSDVSTYRSTFNLPSLTTCSNPISTGSGPCFLQVNQSGGSSLPHNSTSWSQEISLDLDMVSAICPYCNILLLEASSATISNLGTAVKTANSMGAVAISNSYGASGFSSETSYDSYYNQPGSAVTVSAGDGGYGVDYPAASPSVIAVGGTSLSSASNARGWSETVWSNGPSQGTGSGCSTYEPNPGWQPVTSQCSTRTVADVSAVADPYTGVAVYDTYGTSGWLVFGGTSVSSPIIASVIALAGNASTFSAAALYGAGGLWPVTKGSNATCGNYLCDATQSLSGSYSGHTLVDFNGPTGNGTPDGTSSF